MNETSQILKNIAKHITDDQEHLHEIGQATPSFYMIMESKPMSCDIEEADVLYILDEDTEYRIGKGMPDYEFKRAKEIIFNGENDFDTKDGEGIRNGEELERYLFDGGCDEARDHKGLIHPCRFVNVLNRNYMFFSYEEAKACIEKVPYRFSKDAHPYAMTPDSLCKDYRILYETLQKIDWERSRIILKKERKETDSEYGKIFGALGFTRDPASAEKTIMNRWLVEWEMPINVILEACGRTLLHTGRPFLAYTDAVLRSWHEKGVKTMKDIEMLDIRQEARVAVRKELLEKYKKEGC